MNNGADNFTAERIAKLRQNIDFSDIPEIETFSDGHLRNWKPIKKPVSFRIDLDNLQWLQSAGVKGYQKKMNEVIRWARQNGCPLI
ncbi:BrnA antitoxin family protein [Treponema sp. OMZ 840]|uniref:BrnA antitoxin family protein n=1 Tax=Treponema sp. OMZ 840 TaxID=244313 RepID=UPI003D8B0D34